MLDGTLQQWSLSALTTAYRIEMQRLSMSPHRFLPLAPMSNFDSEMTTRRSLAWNLWASPAFGASRMRPSCRITKASIVLSEWLVSQHSSFVLMSCAILATVHRSQPVSCRAVGRCIGEAAGLAWVMKPMGHLAMPSQQLRHLCTCRNHVLRVTLQHADGASTCMKPSSLQTSTCMRGTDGMRLQCKHKSLLCL